MKKPMTAFVAVVTAYLGGSALYLMLNRRSLAGAVVALMAGFLVGGLMWMRDAERVVDDTRTRRPDPGA